MPLKPESSKSLMASSRQSSLKSSLGQGPAKNIELCKTWVSEKTLSQITEALEIDVAKLFLSIVESFKKNKENSAKLKSAIANDVRNYVNEILKEFD